MGTVQAPIDELVNRGILRPCGNSFAIDRAAHGEIVYALRVEEHDDSTFYTITREHRFAETAPVDVLETEDVDEAVDWIERNSL